MILRMRTWIGCGLAAGLAMASWRDVAGEVPSETEATGSEYVAAMNAKFRFGTDVGGRFVTIADAPYESADPEHTAEKDFEAAMAKLIAVTLDHPGTEAASRAQCVLDAAEKSLRERATEKELQPVFTSWVPMQR